MLAEIPRKMPTAVDMVDSGTGRSAPMKLRRRRTSIVPSAALLGASSPLHGQCRTAAYGRMRTENRPTGFAPPQTQQPEAEGCRYPVTHERVMEDWSVPREPQRPHQELAYQFSGLEIGNIGSSAIDTEGEAVIGS